MPLKPWKTPTLVLLGHDNIHSGTHSGHNENTIANSVFSTSNGNTTWYFETQNGFDTIVNKGNPKLYFDS